MTEHLLFFGGSGTEDEPYIITNAWQLAYVAKYVNNGNTWFSNRHYQLGNNIDLAAIHGLWMPMGIKASSPFKGVFDGVGNTGRKNPN